MRWYHLINVFVRQSFRLTTSDAQSQRRMIMSEYGLSANGEMVELNLKQGKTRESLENPVPDYGRLARWIKWRACDVGEAKEGLENELWHTWSNGWVGEWAVTWVKRRKGWRMSCDVGEVTERLDNELCYVCVSSALFSNLSVTSPTSQLIIQPFRHFTYVTAHSPTLPLLHICHSSFSNLSFASPTSQTLHLRHLASRPW